MTEQQFPEEVKNFIRFHIASIEMLEILLFVHQHRERSFSVTEVLKQVQSSQQSIQQRLNELRDRGLVVQAEGQQFQFVPDAPDLNERVDSLRKCYATWRLKVIEYIYSGKTDGVQAFSDAFKFRKGK